MSGITVLGLYIITNHCPNDEINFINHITIKTVLA